MTLATLRERYALDLFEPIWKKKGYTVIREPSSQQLPSFLRGLRPDAIATGAEPALVIEVAAGRGAPKKDQILRLKSAVDSQAGWRLEVVYVGSEGEPIKAASPGVVEAALQRARGLADDEPNAALLLAWAALEAVARRLEPGLAEYTLGALALVDLLVGYGHLTQEAGVMLRSLASTRNRVAHGELDALASSEGVATLVTIVDGLMRRDPVPPQPAH